MLDLSLVASFFCTISERREYGTHVPFNDDEYDVAEFNGQGCAISIKSSLHEWEQHTLSVKIKKAQRVEEIKDRDYQGRE